MPTMDSRCRGVKPPRFESQLCQRVILGKGLNLPVPPASPPVKRGRQEWHLARRAAARSPLVSVHGTLRPQPGTR